MVKNLMSESGNRTTGVLLLRKLHRVFAASVRGLWFDSQAWILYFSLCKCSKLISHCFTVIVTNFRIENSFVVYFSTFLNNLF